MIRFIPVKKPFACLALIWMTFFFTSSPGMAVGEPVEHRAKETLYVVTIHPLAAILERVVGQRGKVFQLLPPSSSPHTFEPKPSDAILLGRAKALFYAGANLDKEWTAGLPVGRRIEMLQLVPAKLRLKMPTHQHHPGHSPAEEPAASPDPHFWTDPLTVKALLPALVDSLSELDREGRREYELNAARFGAKLTALNRQVSALLQPIQGEPIMMFHPSFQYLFNRYNLKLAGVIEPFPGREPSPKFLQHLVKTIKQLDIKALFTEPQLPKRPARVLAETGGLKIYELDPLGGSKGRKTYEEIILYNARTLAKALEHPEGQ